MVSRFAAIIERAQAAILAVPSAWRTATFRRSAAMAICVLIGVWLLCSLPLRDDRPLIDISVATSRVVSTMVDAFGVVHYVDAGGTRIVQPQISTSVSRIATGGGLTTIAMLACLWWAAIRAPSTRTMAGLSIGVVGVVVTTNVMTLFLVVLVGGGLDYDLTAGIPWIATSVFRIALALGLLYCLLQTVDTVVAIWEFRRAVRNLDGSTEFPIPVTNERRRETSVLAGAFVCLLGLWMVGRASTTQTLITIYRDVAAQSLIANDLPRAKVAVERLRGLDAVDPEHRFLAAKVCEAEGDVVEAELLVRDIVVAGGRKFAPAHRWLADQIARRRSHLSNGRAEDDDEPVELLASATLADPTDINAHVALAEAYLARRSPRQAVRELEGVVDQRPDLRLTLAQLSVIAGQRDSARQHAQIARDFYEDKMKALPMSREARLRLAASLIFLEDFAGATAVLLKGWEQTSDQVYQQALGTSYLVWHDTAARRKATKAERLSLLEQSLRYAPDNAQTLERVAVLATTEIRSGPAIDLLTRALEHRAIPASVHFILGTNACQHGRSGNALRHLEEAHRIEPDNVEILNNLAWVLAFADPPQLERARELADEAVRRSPNQASLRETRGQVLAKLGNWSEAIADLENALQVMKGNSGLHATLAKAYTELGDKSLAAEHWRMAEELTGVE